ncbi:MAG: hypothetical protein PVG32_21795 [Anaerolineales bacterium]
MFCTKNILLLAGRDTAATNHLKGWRFDGLIFLLYGELFCLQRFIFEFWRANNPTLFGPFH